jgi:RimJ/RimL family protein N-acetyltransferase
MSPFWTVRTARLVLTPVGGGDLPDLIRLKSDPRVFAVMLGGVRSAARTVEELAEEVACWGAHGWGIWTVRARDNSAFVGLTGFMRRPDASRCGRRCRVRASRARRRERLCVMATTRRVCRALSPWRGQATSPRGWCLAGSG